MNTLKTILFFLLIASNILLLRNASSSPKQDSYSSTNADYAEWLERITNSESIEKGSIVAVKAGKITKNINNAEQLLVVSHRPAVAANRPSKSWSRHGNYVAFLGQVPVRVIGAVQTGDYIIAQPDHSGVGKAVAPANLHINDYQRIVGRAWEANSNEGLKKVNTVVGLATNQYFSLFQKQVEQEEKLSERIQNLEEQIDALKEHN